MTSNSFEKKECDREYEQRNSKSGRKIMSGYFLKKSSGLMFCTICKEYAKGFVEKACSFVAGCANLRIEEKSLIHEMNHSYFVQ